MNKRYLTTTSALALALALGACGSTGQAQSGDPAAHGGGHNASSAPPAGATTDTAADVSFLTGMKPHHEQAIEMSEMVLAANPPAPVAELAREVKAAQGPEIVQMDQMLTSLGQSTDSAVHGGGHMGGHGGMMSEADMAALGAAQGTEAARMYLTGMIEHHKGAIAAAESELRDGRHEPARALATDIARDQAAEVTRMQQLLTQV